MIVGLMTSVLCDVIDQWQHIEQTQAVIIF